MPIELNSFIYNEKYLINKEVNDMINKKDNFKKFDLKQKHINN